MKKVSPAPFILQGCPRKLRSVQALVCWLWGQSEVFLFSSSSGLDQRSCLINKVLPITIKQIVPRLDLSPRLLGILIAASALHVSPIKTPHVISV